VVSDAPPWDCPSVSPPFFFLRLGTDVTVVVSRSYFPSVIDRRALVAFVIIFAFFFSFNKNNFFFWLHPWPTF
jgi:hypothetical protein